MPKAHKRDDSQSSYYFLHTEGIKPPDGGAEVIEEMPQGFKAEQFTPRPVNTHRKHPSTIPANIQPTNPPPPSKPSFLNRLMQRATGGPRGRDIYANSHKIDPKVYFSVERTYLAWMHTAILLAGISMAMMDYSEEGDNTAFYGLLLLPVGIAFILYAMYQYAKRNHMLLSRSPGPYEDKWGPIILGSLFVAALLTQALIMMIETK
ncbi:unnamed protein product [Cylindrotheca closterium]|uniref:DUF202 domain-containing protein n=1 Tax=Cylindrotheca closterium TaxID=2856 RepID=A0AAD2PWV8_9STRA|nr:unnamed protein product [Cylindrotheca closterium]